MKKLIILLLFSTTVRAQDNLNGAPVKDGIVNYSGIQNIDSLILKDSYLKAREWFVKNFPDKDATIKIEDTQNYQLVGRGNLMQFTDELIHDGIIECAFKISFKEGKYKYEFTDLIAKFRINSDGKYKEIPLENWINNAAWKKLFYDLNIRTFSYAQNLKEFLTKSDW